MKRFSALMLLSCFFTFSVVKAQNSQHTLDTVRLTAISEGYRLPVTVIKKQNLSGKKLPAIVFLVGSNVSSTLKNYQDYTSFFLENELLNHFALVYFDKRGLGQSEGKWYNTSLEQRALDAKNVAEVVGQLTDIDAKKIYALGHSQGGWITQIALSHYPSVFAGGVSMAGPTYNVRTQIVNDYKSLLQCQGMSAKKAFKKAKRKVRRELFLVSIFSKQDNWKQLRLIKKYKPEPVLKNLQKPILLLFAENDRLVYPNWCMDQLNHVFPSGIPHNFEIYIAPGQNHSFKIAEKCNTKRDRDLHYAIETRQKITDWLLNQVAKQ